MPLPPWSTPTGLDGVVASWLASGYVRPCLTADRTLPAIVYDWITSAEFDALLSSKLGSGSTNSGHAGWLQADVEIWRGVHLVPAVERLRSPEGGAAQLGLWGGAAWFVVPHLDVRADFIRRSASDSPTTGTFLIQVNGYL